MLDGEEVSKEQQEFDEYGTWIELKEITDWLNKKYFEDELNIPDNVKVTVVRNAITEKLWVSFYWKLPKESDK